ncbi:MAG: hypothetical protein U0075_19280 [Thermomicrobiales bacterium]
MKGSMTLFRSTRTVQARPLVIFLTLALLLNFLPSLVVAQPSTPEVTTYGGGVSTFLSCTADQCRQGDRQDVFAVEPDTALHLELGFVQWYPEAKEFRVFLLLNYQQTPFAVRQDVDRVTSDRAPLGSPIAMPDASEVQPVFEFTAPPEREFYFEFRTEPLAPGYYDLALLFVPDPYKTQHELRYWTIYRFVIRASVYVGDQATPPAMDFPLLDSDPHDPVGSGEMLLLGSEPHKLGQAGEQSVRAGEDVTLAMNYQPYADNLIGESTPDIPIPTAFIAVIDDRVVPLNGQPVVHGAVLPGRISYIPVTVTVPDDPGTHQLFIQHFPNPYVDVVEAEEANLDLVGISSQRLILDAR